MEGGGWKKDSVTLSKAQDLVWLGEGRRIEDHVATYERQNPQCYHASMSTFFFETDAPEPCPITFGGAADVLVHFISFAFAARYGSQHELTKLALLLRLERKIDFDPLTTFAGREIEVEADAVELERVWQDAAPLAATLRRIIEALASPDERIAALTADAPNLGDRLRDLHRMAAWAAERGVRVRMTFDL